MPNNEKRAINTHTDKINSDSSERTYIHLSNGVIYNAMKFLTHLQYEYTEVAVDLFSEKIALVHCLVAVCI